MGGAPTAPVVVPQPHRRTPTPRSRCKGDHIPVTAHTASDDEKPRLWQIVTEQWPNYDVYQTRTDRVIPVVVLSAVDDRSAAAVRRRRWAERAADRSPAGAAVAARRGRSSRRTLIVAAARRLIAERGERFTTQELVKEAGVALQTFYRIFGGKDQLLLAVFEDLIAESCAEYEAGGRPTCPIRSRGCTSTSPSRSAAVGDAEHRHRAPLRHRRALAAAPALPGGDGRTPPSTSPTWSQRQLELAARRGAARRRATRSATRGSSPSS